MRLAQELRLIQACIVRPLNATFNEDEPRDSHGRWTTAGGETMYERESEGGKKALEQPHLKAIRIPPAWTNVSVNPNPNGKLMVVGKDSKGRSQHIYSKAHSQGQADAKFARMAELERMMPEIIKKNDENRQSEDLKTKEAADVLALIMHTGIRPGGEGDTGADKKAYGATTLQGRHVVEGANGSVRLKFVGKKGVDLSIPIKDQAIASMLLDRAKAVDRKSEIFPDVSAAELSAYVKQVTGGGDYKTKDFRTLLANRIAAVEVAKIKPPTDPKSFKKKAKEVATVVAKKLGNTAAIALSSYINPMVFATGWKQQYA